MGRRLDCCSDCNAEELAGEIAEILKGAALCAESVHRDAAENGLSASDVSPFFKLLSGVLVQTAMKAEYLTDMLADSACME